MREPMIEIDGVDVPYSLTDAWRLQRRATGQMGANRCEHPESYDPDFRRRYAAILLRERGC